MSNYSCVNDKISGVFVTQNRPLKEGETPKRPGETHVYEAVNQLSPAFKEAIASGEEITVSWKIDGTCCKIENGIYYRRRDIRKGSVPPPGSIPGDIDENGVARIAWIPLNGSNDPDDKYHLTSFSNPQRTAVWVLDQNKISSELELSTVTSPTTFELIGPKVGENLYDIPDFPVQVPLKKKTETLPRHYLIFHGAFRAPIPLYLLSSPNPLEIVREIVQNNLAEGLVFRCGDKYFKVNQGHLQCHNHGTKLLLAGKGDAKEVLGKYYSWHVGFWEKENHHC